MKRCRWLVLLCASVGLSADAGVLVDYGSTWNYFVGTAEASSPDKAAWRQPGFDVAEWKSGAAPLGYAEPPNSPAEDSLVTILPTSSAGGYVTVFLRRMFEAKNPADARELTLSVNIDDGFIAWINGREVGRSNVPDGEPSFNTSAAVAGEPTLVSVSITNNLSEMLVPGMNVLAVQVFNGGQGSSDLVFDALLTSDLDEAAPAIIDIIPPPGSIVGEFRTVEVVFNENVMGVDAADLWINDTPATSLSIVSPRNYVFSFSQPAAGTVQVKWAGDHGITDLATTPNAFAGGNWSYTLDLTAPNAAVMISEFMAANENGIRDDDGNRVDWLELFNMSSLPVNLDGWFLTDSYSNLTRWRIPAVTLDAKKYLLIWASEKNRTNVAAPLHTIFKIEKSGGYLALVDPNTNVVSEFRPYPGQRSDISYGRDAVNASITGYFVTPTPGAANSTSGPGFAPEPVLSRDSGVYTNASISLTMSATAGEIRYTTDGSVPTTTSPLYAAPLTFAASAVVKARVFQSGLLPSAVVARSFVLVDNTVANFSSKLPLLILTTGGRGIAENVPPGGARTFASMTAIDTFRGRSSPLGRPEHLGVCELEVRGQTSSGMPKRPYNMEIQNEYRQDLDVPLLGMPAGSDWVLNNPYTDKPFLQNFLAYELHEKMGHYAVRRRFVEVFVDTSGGKVAYPGDYAGIYLLLEKIRIDDNRVNAKRLTPYDNAEPNISGGYMFKKDKDSQGDLDFYTSGGAGFSGQRLKLHEPKPREITPQQLTWLQNYIEQFERALYANNWKTATGTNHYSWYIDIDSFVDNHWIVEFAKQIDGYRLSNYLHKDRGGKIHMDPIWDWNLSFGNADYYDGGRTNGWYYTVVPEYDHIWLRRLMNGTTSPGGTTGDPDFNQRIADRWTQFRTNVLSASNVLARVDEMAALLTESAARDFQKWPRLGSYIWPNPNGPPTWHVDYVRPTTYAGIISEMKKWIQGRYNWIDSQFLKPVQISQPSGRVPAGHRVTLSTPAGAMYYTLDGSDPRLSGGGISSNALVFLTQITIARNAHIVVRARSGSRWSGPTESILVVDPPPLVISEIMYHPAAPPAGSAFTDTDFEFLEVKNTGTTPLNLQGFKLADGVEFVFPDHELAAGLRAVVVRNRAAFESRYGTNLPVIGEFIGALDNSGERIKLIGSLGEPVLNFEFNDAWHPITDGAGFSLVATADTPSNSWSDKASWTPGATVFGSPGAAEPTRTAFPSVVINEALTNPQAPDAAAVELHNLDSTAAEIGGWFITNDSDVPKKFRVPDGMRIPGGGFVKFTGTDFGSSPNALVPFALSPLGGEVYLFSADLGSNLTGYRHGFKFGGQKPGVTVGRHVTSDGREHFVAQGAPSLEASNGGPAAGPVVITEIMYRPPDVLANGAYWNNTEDEYIEIFNATEQPVQLFDTQSPTNTWRIRGFADFEFAPNSTLAARGFLLVVNFDPALNPLQLAAFRSKYQVTAGTPIVGPYRANLDNGNGSVSLQMPAAPLPAGADVGKVPFVVVDAVNYDDDPPWSAAPDGTGFALHRVDAAGFANEPANWQAAAPSPGAPFTPSSAPIITSQPLGQIAIAGQDVAFTVAAAGAGALKFQWRFNGSNLQSATNATLMLTNVSPPQSGSYVVIVMNATGAAVSAPARLSVDVDSDNDSMADAWEMAHRLNWFDNSDASVDTDQDGLANRDEYIAGTDPQSSGSYLRVERITLSAGTTITFNAAADRSYTIQFSDAIVPPVWRMLSDVASRGTNFTATITDGEATSGRYYRLVTPSQP